MSNIKNPQNNPLKNPAPVRPPGGSTAPKTVYVCSPFRPTAVSGADREAEQRSNIERALKACRILAMIGIQPLAPHLYFTRFLKDDVAAERDAGCGLRSRGWSRQTNSGCSVSACRMVWHRKSPKPRNWASRCIPFLNPDGWQNCSSKASRRKTT